MKHFFEAVYGALCALGLLTFQIVSGLFWRGPKKIWSAIRNFFRLPGSKAATSGKKSVFLRRRILALTLAFLLILSSLVIVHSESERTDAVEVRLNGEVLGVVETEDDADLAVGLALQEDTAAKTPELDCKDIRADRSKIQSAAALSDVLLTKLTKGKIKVTEVYINNRLICAVRGEETASKVFSARLSAVEKKYPNASVSLAESVTYKPAYYKADDSAIWSGTQLDMAVDTLGLLTYQHTTCEKAVSQVNFDTVEIETNALFKGDSLVTRAGQAGKELVLNLVTYIGSERLYSQKLTSVKISDPVSQVVEKGIRAGSITVGSYTVTQTTGYFCWPVVGLHTITSPFGPRSLGYHRGMDISGANAAGSLVVAAASGTVEVAGWSTGGYGNYVIIDHGNGVETLYGHMLNDSLMVSAGEKVTKGQALGRVGNTGYSFGAHLHFEVRINGVRVNPAPYLGLNA